MINCNMRPMLSCIVTFVSLVFFQNSIAANCKEKAMCSIYKAIRADCPEGLKALDEKSIEWLKGRGVTCSLQREDGICVITLSKNHSLYRTVQVCSHVLIRADDSSEDDPFEDINWKSEPVEKKKALPRYSLNVEHCYKNKHPSPYRWLRPAKGFVGQHLVEFDDRVCDLDSSLEREYFMKGGIINIKFYDTSEEIRAVVYNGKTTADLLVSALKNMEINRSGRFEPEVERILSTRSLQKSKLPKRCAADDRGLIISEIERQIRTECAKSALQRLRQLNKAGSIVSDEFYQLQEDLENLRTGRGGGGKNGKQDYHKIIQIISHSPKLKERAASLGLAVS